MPDNPLRRVRWLRLAGAMVLLSLGLVQARAANAQSAIAAIPAGMARIWFYRDYDIYVNRNYATVMVNGAVAGSVQPYGGVIYRDVAPGEYRLSAESVGTDVNQDVDVVLAPGQEVYVKILNLPSWASDGNVSSYQRDTYYLRVMPAQTARAEMARRPF